MSDAVFAFAVTLLVVSLEAPKRFDDLLRLMHGFVSFGICFALLLMIWHAQYIYFRRYSLDDKTSFLLNAALLFVVAFYIYPLMMIYGGGFIALHVIFALLYMHAYKLRDALEPSPMEAYETRGVVQENLLMIGRSQAAGRGVPGGGVRAHEEF